MPLHSIENAKLRSDCKEIIENLEIWLRRLIDEEMTKVHGNNYIECKNASGDFLIKKKIKDDLGKRQSKNPSRFPRLIDAATLEEEIYFICHPELYAACFRKPLSFAFPDGNAECRTFLKRLIEPRNKLYHANPISVRDAERVICYSNDIIEALKNHYKSINMIQEYDCPQIIRVLHSFGNKIERSAFNFTSGRSVVRLPPESPNILRPGETLSIEAAIDPSFRDDEYSVIWKVMNKKVGDGKKVVIPITMAHVRESLHVVCILKSDKEWHKFGAHDEYAQISSYKVLPPLT